MDLRFLGNKPAEKAAEMLAEYRNGKNYSKDLVRTLINLFGGYATYTQTQQEALIITITQAGYLRFHNMNFHINMDWDNNSNSINFLSF